MNYYENELKKVNVDSEYAPTLQVRSGEGGDNTKWMNVNRESATALVKWLNANFLKPKEHDVVKSKKEINGIPAGTEGTVVHVYPDGKNFEVEFAAGVHIMKIDEIELKN